MTERASSLHRRMTAERITRCAQELAEQRGLDGFTMDDLAECAGVSRRTLFNYVAGKHDAVLGAPSAPDVTRLDEFRRGGPTGRLADDIKAVIAALLDSKQIAAEEWDRTRRLVATDVRLQKALHDKFATVADFLTEAILERDGDRFDRLRARAAARLTLSLFDLALDCHVEDPSATLADYYMTAFDGAAAVFA